MWQIRIYDMKHHWDKNYELMELVKEVEENPGTDSMIEVNGRTYKWCAISNENKIYSVREVTLNHDPEEEYDGELKCPYCGNVDDDAWERVDSEQTECGSCGSEIEYERHVEVSYSVSPIKLAPILTL